MSAFSSWLIEPAGLTPYGFCLLWEPGLIWTYATADLFIWLSYLTIPIALSILASKRRDLVFRPFFMLFAVFISLCGVSHLLDVLTLWIPAYGIQALVKSGTAIVSLVTAMAVWRFLPGAFKLPSNAQMQEQAEELGRMSAEAAGHERLIDMVNGAAVMLREIDGTIRFWSAGCRRLYGWTAEQAIGHSLHELLKTSFPVPVAEIEAALSRDGFWNGELRQRTRDGHDINVSVSKMLHRYDNGPDVVVMENVTDITALREAETRLSSSEAQLASLVETAADGIIIARADGAIESVNRAILGMFGYDRAEELIGQNLRVLMPTGEAMRHDSYIAGAPPRVIGTPGRELLAVRRDGTAFPIDLSVSSFGAEGSRFLTGIIRDATIRQQSEATLRSNEARLRLVQQVGGVAYSDQMVSEPERLISGEFANLYGLPPTQTRMTDQEWAALLHPDDRDRVIAERSNILQHGGTLTTEFRIYRCDGAIRWVTKRLEMFLGADGAPNRVICAQRDITEIVAARQALAVRQQELEQRVAERTAALAEAEARFRGIFDSQFQFINLLGLDGTILEANRTALDAGGLTRGDVIGKPIWGTAWWPVHERDQLREEIARAAQGAVIRRDIEINGESGRTIWIDFSLTPTREPATNAVKWIIAEGRDLTEKRTMANQLAQAQKVQALGQLAGGIAHDFNNILQAVSGAASLIERRPSDHDRTRHLAGAIVSAANRGSSITQRLLSFARRGELRAEPLATADLIGNLREVLEHTLGTTITVVAVIPAQIPALIADQAQLETAIINLGTNARDAMPDGGTLTLSAEAEHVGAEDHHPAGLATGDYVRLGVADTGTGMNAATLSRVSEPFFTTKLIGQGTGLGVAMVKGFAEQSGGALSIASAPGTGTKVSVWLRQATGDMQAAPTVEKQVLTAIGVAARILVVDDDDLVREMVAASLEDAGFGTLVASSGLEAIALIEAGETVDAMVSDLSMPGMNGVATIQKVRALRPRLPCFLLTGYVGERAALSADNTFTLVRKPVSGRALVAQIEASLESARQ